MAKEEEESYCPAVWYSLGGLKQPIQREKYRQARRKTRRAVLARCERLTDSGIDRGKSSSWRIQSRWKMSH